MRPGQDGIGVEKGFAACDASLFLCGRHRAETVGTGCGACARVAAAAQNRMRQIKERHTENAQTQRSP